MLWVDLLLLHGSEWDARLYLNHFYSVEMFVSGSTCHFECERFVLCEIRVPVASDLVRSLMIKMVELSCQVHDSDVFLAVRHKWLLLSLLLGSEEETMALPVA